MLCCQPLQAAIGESRSHPAAQVLLLDLEVVGAAIHGVFDLDLPVGGMGLNLSPALVWGD